MASGVTRTAMPENVGEAAAMSDGPSDKLGLFADIKHWVQQDRDHWAPWFKEAEIDANFVAGHQWDEDDLMILREQNRPEVTFNRTGATIDSIVGLEIGNRRETQFLPREQGDVKKNEILTSAGQWARDECDAEDEESDAFHDVTVTGLGHIETRIDYDDNPDGMIRMDRIDWREVLPDCNARKRNLIDGRRISRIRTMSVRDAQALLEQYGDFTPEEIDAAWARDLAGNAAGDPHNADPEAAYRQGNQNTGEDYDDTDDVTVLHFQWWERRHAWKVALGPKLEVIDEAQYKELNKRAKEAGFGQIKGFKVPKKVYRQAYVGSESILWEGETACPTHFSIQTITGKRDPKTNTWFGIIRAMRDPQRWANKWLSQGMHIMNTMARSGYFAEVGVFENVRDAEETIAQSGKITLVKKGALAEQRIIPKQSNGFPQDIAQLMEFAISSIRDVSGVNLELLGLKDQEQAGVLEAQRKQAGMTILAMLFDSLRRYRKRQGGLMLYFLTNVIGDGRLIKVVGEEGAQYVPFIHEPGTAEYDVIIDEAPTSPNQKEQTWALIERMMPFMGKNLGPDELLALAEYSPLPSNVLEKLKAARAKSAEAEAPVQQRAQEAELRDKEAAAALKEAQAKKALADAGATERGDAVLGDILGGQGGNADGSSDTDLRIAIANAEKAEADAYKAKMQAVIAEHQAQLAPLQGQLDLAAGEQQIAAGEQDMQHDEMSSEQALRQGEQDIALGLADQSTSADAKADEVSQAASGSPQGPIGPLADDGLGGGMSQPPGAAGMPMQQPAAPAGPDPQMVQILAFMAQQQQQQQVLLESIAQGQQVLTHTLEALKGIRSGLDDALADPIVDYDEDNQPTQIRKGSRTRKIGRDENGRLTFGD